ncbi:hypothetical protein LNP25_13630 [Klebsiella variicola subsp. variicola]|nr:hypothetical protein [Klebsiella variicola subsp. variicola]
MVVLLSAQREQGHLRLRCYFAGWRLRLTRPTKPKQQTRQAQRHRARSRFMPGGGCA